MTNMKQSISNHYLGAKGLTEKEIKDYYKNLKDLRHAISKNASDRLGSEYMFELPGGYRFFYQQWDSTLKSFEKSPKAIIFAFHGAYSSSDCFYPLADALNPIGVTIVSLDYRGMGRTGGQAGGKLGDLNSFNEIFEDFYQLVLKYRQEFNVPMYFFGYDIGALVAMRVIAKYPVLRINALILVSPTWRLKSNIKHLFLYPFVLVGQNFTKSNTSHKVLEEKIEKTYFPEYKTYTQNNPFRLQKMSLRMFKKLLDLINGTHRFVKKLKLPCLILQGTEDHLVNHFSVHKLYEKWPHKNKFIRFYENAGHNLLVDKFTQEIYIETGKFLNLNEIK